MFFSPDIPIKVVGFLPQNKERSLLLKTVYALFERLSIYRYGRVELNLFISEKEYLVNNTILFSLIYMIIDLIGVWCVHLVYCEDGVGHTDVTTLKF